MGRRVEKRRRRLHPGRTIRLLVVIAALIAGIVLLVNACTGEKNPGGNTADDTQNNIQTDEIQSSGDATQNDDQQQEELPPPEVDPYEGYELLTMTEADMHAGELILVSNAVPYVFPEGGEEKLVTVMSEKNLSYMSKDYETAVLPVTVEHLNDMMKAFTDQGGSVTVMVVSGYRTYDYQQGLFDRSAARNGLDHAKRFVAQPGGSEHHTGYAVDLWSTTANDYFEGVGEYKWVTDNCHNYGFILRYTSEKEEFTQIGPESWHFRYIGVPHSNLVVENGFCHEEYMAYLKQYPFEGEHLSYTLNGTEYEIYYAAGLEVPVPQEGNYTVSGNNEDGFIVTVTK